MRQQRDIGQSCLRLVDEDLQHVNNGLGELGYQHLAVLAVVIFCHNTRLSIVNLDAHNHSELRRTSLEALNAHLATVLHIAGHHSQLIGEGQFRRVTIIGSNTGKGILLMLHGLIETLADILDKVYHTSVSEFCGKRQRIHEHTKGVLDADIAASAADGADIQVFIACKAGKDQQRGCQRQVSWCHRVLTAELFDSGHIKGAIHFCRLLALMGCRQVGSQFCSSLTGA